MTERAAQAGIAALSSLGTTGGDQLTAHTRAALQNKTLWHHKYKDVGHLLACGALFTYAMDPNHIAPTTTGRR